MEKKAGSDMAFTHLQVKSGYSIMKSVNRIDKLVQAAKENGFSSLALTDEFVLHGTVPFYKACREAGIKPIIGMVIEVEKKEKPPAKGVVLARNNIGYHNLLKLSTYINRQERKIVSKEELSGFTPGLIGILSASAFLTPEQLTSGVLDEQAFTEWKDLFEEDSLYMGLELSIWKHSKSVASLLTSVNKDFLPVVGLGDVRYLQEDDRLAYECLNAIREGIKYEATDQAYQKSTYHLMTEAEIEAIIPHEFAGFLSNTEKIAEQCNVTIDLSNRMLPSYPVPETYSPSSYLRSLSEAALKKKIKNPTEQENQRMEYELSIIEKMGFSDYFLIVWDFIDFAKKQGIMVGPGRGSAAGSFVAYLLGITDVNPLEYDLLFERFLNPERISMPDIDIDFSDHRRDEVIQYVKNKYGEEHVAQIITFGTFGTKSLLRELMKTLNVDSQDSAFVMKELAGETSKPISEAVKSSSNLVAYIRQSTKLRTLFKAAIRLEGLPRHISTHAAGVVISESLLVEHVPLMKGNEGVALTQFAMGELEAIGLLKMDFLGLRNLTLMERIITSINYATKVHLKLENLPLEDKKTFQLFQAGNTNGVFQFESQGMQEALKRLVPTRFEDVVAVNALYRPGPMEYIPLYADRKHGRQPISYPHPDLEPILENTYGVLVYQEQIMQIASKFAGFSMGEADILRRAVSKKQSEVMQTQQEKFVQGCVKNGYRETVANEIFQWIVRFSDYGFNRSHAVAYSMISFRLGYLKAHYPSFFLAELMSSATGSDEKLQLYIREAIDADISVLPPSINNSYGKFSVDKNAIRFGLFSIKGIGNQVVSKVIDERKKNGVFKDLFDFCRRIPVRVVNRSGLESLILAGAFDELYNNRAALLATIDQALEQGELFSEFDGQPSFFEQELELEADYVKVEEFSPMKKLELEKQVLGFYLSSHPLKDYRSSLQQSGVLTLKQALNKKRQNQVKIAVSIQEIKKIRTKRGESMAFVKISDETMQSEAVFFPELFREVNRWLEEEKLVILIGKLESRNNRKQWLVSECFPIEGNSTLELPQERLYIQLKKIDKEKALQALKQLAVDYPGSVSPIVYEPDTKKTYQLSSEYGLDSSRDNLKELELKFGKENVVLKK